MLNIISRIFSKKERQEKSASPLLSSKPGTTWVVRPKKPMRLRRTVVRIVQKEIEKARKQTQTENLLIG